jgi:hypothetical protein
VVSKRCCTVNISPPTLVPESDATGNAPCTILAELGGREVIDWEKFMPSGDTVSADCSKKSTALLLGDGAEGDFTSDGSTRSFIRKKLDQKISYFPALSVHHLPGGCQARGLRKEFGTRHY